MKFLVLGASGATGTLFVEAATAAGHEVVALVRSPEKLRTRDGLHLVQGDVRDVDALAPALAGVDALVSALGVGRTRRPDDLMRDATRAVLEAARRTGQRRIVWQSAFGVGDSYVKASLPIRCGYHLAPAVFRDKAAGEQLLRASGLAWTIVYPGVLTHGPRSPRVTATDLDDVGKVRGIPRVSRTDVAAFLLEAASDDTWNRRIAVLRSPAR